MDSSLNKQVYYPEYVHVCLCWFGSHCFTQHSARLPERRKKEDEFACMRGRRFRFTTLETSVSHAKDIFKFRKIDRSFLDN